MIEPEPAVAGEVEVEVDVVRLEGAAEAGVVEDLGDFAVVVHRGLVVVGARFLEFFDAVHEVGAWVDRLVFQCTLQPHPLIRRIEAHRCHAIVTFGSVGPLKRRNYVYGVFEAEGAAFRTGGMNRRTAEPTASTMSSFGPFGNVHICCSNSGSLCTCSTRPRS